jgi:hypothetical protein
MWREYSGDRLHRRPAFNRNHPGSCTGPRGSNRKWRRTRSAGARWGQITAELKTGQAMSMNDVDDQDHILEKYNVIELNRALDATAGIFLRIWVTPGKA